MILPEERMNASWWPGFTLAGKSARRRWCMGQGGWCVLLMLLLLAALALQPAWFAAATGSLWLLLGLGLLYAVLLAIPFVPSIEIGLLLMLAFGRPGIAVAYLATLVGLNLAYLVGRYIRARGAILRLPHLPPRLVAMLNSASERRLLPVIILGGLLNMPGNTVLGGGGGISLVYGAWRLLSWPLFLAVVAVVTAVVPALVLLGVIGVERVVGTGA
ncbi:MAG: hypothetical protein JJT90_08150 [Ectothiorhodospiraceae bacterium]|nr:hypothetical protein [Ectothiorhodospiraceae bacterium]